MIRKLFIIVATNLIYEKIKLLISNTISFLIFFVQYKLLSNTGNNQSNKLLCINTGDLGDNIVIMKLLLALQNSNKYNEYFLLVKKPNSDIYKSTVLKFKIIEWDRIKYKYNFIYRIKFLKSFISNFYDTALNLTPERGILNDELTLISNSKNKICFTKNAFYLKPFFNRITNSYYSDIIDIKATNEYDKILTIANRINLKVNDKNIFDFNITKSNKRYITIAPFSSDIKRTWGITNFNKLTKELSKKIDVIILGNKEQKKLILENFILSDNVQDYSGTTSLNSLPEIIGKSDLFIGNDSGLTHLALSLSIPLIAITGGGMFGRFFPYSNNKKTIYKYYKMDCFNCRWHCIYKDRYCLTKVDYNDVLVSALNIIAGI